MLTALGAAAAAAAVGAHGMYHRNSPVFGAPIRRVADGCVALTFDDGPNPEATPRILDTLAAHGVKAAFFMLGRHVERWPAIARRVVDEGHVLGNHGYQHAKLNWKGRGYVRTDLLSGTHAIEQATRQLPRYFRAPHGFRSPWVSHIARELGQRTVGWTLGVWDSDRPGAEEIVRRSVHGLKSGGILLLHDGDGYDPAGDRTQTAAALPEIINGVVARGLRLAPLPG